MKTFNSAFVCALYLGALCCAPVATRAQETEAAPQSVLASVALPAKAERVTPANVPAELTTALGDLIKSGGAGVKQGHNEVLVWHGNDFNPARVPALKAQVSADLKSAGWTVEEGEVDPKIGPFTLFSAVRTAPARKGLIGFWMSTDEALFLAWTEMLPTTATTPDSEPPAVADSTLKFDVGASQRTLNVMKGIAPPQPAFPKVALKPGFVCGYVEDWSGKPLQGAVIGVRSSAVGGFYSGASAKTDARGYYEIQAPWGVGSFYCAGYGVDWGDDGRAALGLAPADDEAAQFATANGAVENWVLLPYGIADRDGASEQPQYAGNYYGGTFSISTSVSDSPDSDWELPIGAELELTLTPVGSLFDGSQGRSFVIRRHLQSSSTLFYVNNVPLGRYKLSAQLVHNGKSAPLKIKETGPYANNPFGLEPKEARGQTMLTFRPGGAKAEMATAAHGNWESLNITLTR